MPLPYSPADPLAQALAGPSMAAMREQLASIRWLAGQTRQALDDVRDLSRALLSSGWTGNAAELCSSDMERSLAVTRLLDDDIEVTMRLVDLGLTP